MWVASLCEAFPGRFPTEVLAEYDRLPTGFLEEVLEAGAYREAKARTDAADTKAAVKHLPTTRLYKLVQEIDRDLA